MRSKAIIILLVSLLFAAACAKQDTTQPAAAAQSPTPQPAAAYNANTAQPEQKTNAGEAVVNSNRKTDACSLIASEELRNIQGESVQETKLSERSSGPIHIQHCLYQLPTFSKSLSLELTQSDPAKGAAVDMKKMWEAKFSKAEEEEERDKKDQGGDREKERDKKKGAGSAERRGEEEEGAATRRVEGIGDEAFWVGNNVLGALYILSKNSIIRLSLGGPESEEAKIKKLKVLAQNVINRL